MTPKRHFSVLSSHNCELLFDQDLLDPYTVKAAGARFLIHGIQQQASVFEPVASGGRGQAWFLQLGELSAVLRAYQRGGLIAKFNRQTYFGRAAEKSRSFLEWRLLQWMFPAKSFLSCTYTGAANTQYKNTGSDIM